MLQVCLCKIYETMSSGRFGANDLKNVRVSKKYLKSFHLQLQQVPWDDVREQDMGSLHQLVSKIIS